MVVIEWNPFVNHKLSLEGEYGLEGGYTEAVKFESGKERIHLKNSYIPLRYPVCLWLDNKIKVHGENTEFNEFMTWHDISLRYGTLPFYAPRIGYKEKPNTETGEIGVYQIIPETLNYDRVVGICKVAFEIKELSYIPEILYEVLGTTEDEILLMSTGEQIMILGV